MTKPFSFNNEKICILSPHMDDAAYSLGAWLKNNSGTKTSILTIFSVSNFAPYSPNEHGNCAAVTKLRREEERCFALGVGSEHSFLNFLEAPLRGRPNTCDLFVSPDKATEDSICEKLTLSLLESLSALKPDWLLAPLCIGGHIDHWIVRFAAIRYAMKFRCKIMYYEDLPYAGELEELKLNFVLNVLTNNLQSTLIATDGLDQKVQLLHGYPSQIADSDISNVINHFDRVGGERCWVLDYPKGKDTER